MNTKIYFYFLTILIFASCGTKTTVFRNGYNETGRHKNNLKTGKWVFDDNGRITAIGRFKKDKQNGWMRHYGSNGKIFQKGHYKDDHLHGILKSYYENGNKLQIGRSINGDAEGDWTYYNNNGSLHAIRTYKNGKIIKIQSFFDNKGNSIDCGKVDENGNGYIILYDMENDNYPYKRHEVLDGEIKYW